MVKVAPNVVTPQSEVSAKPKATPTVKPKASGRAASKAAKGDDVEKATAGHLDDQVIQRYVTSTLDEVIGNIKFNYKLAKDWNVKVINNLTRKLNASSDPRKFIVHSTLLPIGNDTGLSVANMCYWQTSFDSTHYVKWQSNTTACIIFIHLIDIE
ncbi:unnamed protein product [Caenorhabditis auriculariae]|uniref:Uncharacterized protein n=1 Tax=Caenorhabditis auriculariae TaxID=2777116 RepID=A0A8S1HR98_9PELO|nr:unnamed protein product [Caenorhabditis auriculariae]